HAGFAEGRAIDSDEVLRPILSGLGLDADALLAGAVSDANKAPCARTPTPPSPAACSARRRCSPAGRCSGATTASRRHWPGRGEATMRIHHDNPDHVPAFVRLVE